MQTKHRYKFDIHGTKQFTYFLNKNFQGKTQIKGNIQSLSRSGMLGPFKGLLTS